MNADEHGCRSVKAESLFISVHPWADHLLNKQPKSVPLPRQSRGAPKGIRAMEGLWRLREEEALAFPREAE